MLGTHRTALRAAGGERRNPKFGAEIPDGWAIAGIRLDLNIDVAEITEKKN